MDHTFAVPPFGSLDIPKGGKLPPPPSYRTVQGKEISKGWVDITCGYDPVGRTLYLPAVPLSAIRWKHVHDKTDREDAENCPWLAGVE